MRCRIGRRMLSMRVGTPYYGEGCNRLPDAVAKMPSDKLFAAQWNGREPAFDLFLEVKISE